MHIFPWKHKKLKSPSLKKKLRFFKKLGYTPHPGQMKIHAVESRFKVVVAASRFGKTTLAAYEIMARALEPDQMIWCVAPTYDLADKVFRIVLEKMVYEMGLPTREVSTREKKIVFDWGTTVRAKSAHIKESLLGEGVDFMVVDEAARIHTKIWTSYLRPRMGDHTGDAFIITSPCGIDGWFIDLYEMGQSDAPEFSEYKSWQCPLWENTLFPPQELIALKNELPPEVYQQEVGAEFVPPGGRVYKSWDAALHVSDKAQFIPGTPFDIAVDFGTRNATAVLFIQRVGERLYNIFDEYYARGLDSGAHAKRIKERVDKYRKQSGHKQIRMYHDPSGLDESITYRKKMSYLIPIKAVNDVQPGINTVRAGLMVRDGRDRPIVLTHPKCKKHIFEMAKYHYPENNEASEIPVPVHDHSCDARRYYFHTVDPLSSFKPDIGLFSNKHASSLVTSKPEFNDYVEESFIEDEIALQEIDFF